MFDFHVLGPLPCKRVGDSDAGKTDEVRGDPLLDHRGRLGIAARLLEPLRRIVTIAGHAPIVLAGALAHRGPPQGVHSEVAGAGSCIERRAVFSRWREELLPLELAQHGIGQRDVASERGMMGVFYDVIVEQIPGALGGELAAAVDQDAFRVPPGHAKIGRSQRGRTSYRQPVIFKRGQVVIAGGLDVA